MPKSWLVSDRRNGGVRALLTARRRTFGLIALGIAITLTWGQSSLEAKNAAEPRRVHYSFDKGDAFVIVTVQETAAGAHGDVVFTKGSMSSTPSYRGSFQISHAEFEQIWSTLNAPGVVKRAVTLTSSGIDLSDDYAFRTADGRYYYVAKASSAPAVSALSSRLRALVDNAMATVKQIPRTAVTALEVLDHGIYDRGPIEHGKSPPDARLIKKTDTVPAHANYHYGFRFRLRGNPEGAPVDITEEFTFPRSRDPKTDKWTTRRREQYTVNIGSVYFAGLFFRNQTEYALGDHTVRIFLGSKLLVEQVFHVVAEK